MSTHGDIIELEFGIHSKEAQQDDDITNMLDENCEQINSHVFDKYIGLNRIFVCLVLQILNPTKRVVMHHEEKRKRHFIPIMKNTINIFHNGKNRVTKIRCNSIKKIE